MIRIESTEQEMKDAGIITDEQVKKNKIALDAALTARNVKLRARRDNAEDLIDSKRADEL